MSDGTKITCRCAQCRIRGLLWPLVVITVGVLFLAGQFSRYGFFDLWPIILIVIGAMLVVQAMVSREGHVGT
ncbi:MAG TPA: DUF5668 domain-containing protein [Candidatus Acidoferrum sp.]|nr:DUF5668 domain-containing protein [Candidatus Acidoferrum sp.]